MLHRGDTGAAGLRFLTAHTGQKRSDNGYYRSYPWRKMNRSDVLQQMDLDRRRGGRIIVSALLGAVILTDVTQVSGRARDEPGARMPFHQMARPLPSNAPPGRSLVLTGVIAFTDPRQGFAIIGSSVQNTYLARPGDQLPDGSLVREVHPNHVVLEYGGKLETVGMYGGGEPTSTAYVPIPPPPQHVQWDAAELKAATAGDAVPSPAPRATDEPPGDPRPDARASDIAGNEHRPHDTQFTDALQRMAEPQAPSPSAQDPADELSDDRRQRIESRRK